eukprot:TRINITY_DN19973_c0_g1_i2.p1 TRINITY_DN19973_c0_g1~~TRINITY_DN19973_c0_g1_i2.p1  ORF type:complete len:275 (+),score=21.18 TRINITY_DN19973_c0_g1_i2:78-902(+)
MPPQMRSPSTSMPHKEASMGAWDRCRMQGKSTYERPGQLRGHGDPRQLRRSSFRADAKHRHRANRPQSAGCMHRGHSKMGQRGNKGTHRGEDAASVSTASTRSAPDGGARWQQGGTTGSCAPVGRGAVNKQRYAGERHMTRKPLVGVPGYSGFQPGVYAGNVHGETYARTGRSGLDETRKYRSGRVPAFEPPARWLNEYGTYSLGAEIPGYGGFVPGMTTGNLIEHCTPRAAKAGWRPPRGFGRGQVTEHQVEGRHKSAREPEPLICGDVSNRQ